jgi:hypothetical protein
MDPGDDLSALVAAFESRTLPRASWTHRAHLRVATWYLLHHDHEEALGRIRGGIQSFNAAHGLTGYHETITIAFARLIAARLGGLRGRAVDEIVATIETELGRSDCLLRHYSRERLLSEEARTTWVPPDVAALPALGCN